MHGILAYRALFRKRHNLCMRPVFIFVPPAMTTFVTSAYHCRSDSSRDIFGVRSLHWIRLLSSTLLDVLSAQLPFSCRLPSRGSVRLCISEVFLWPCRLASTIRLRNISSRVISSCLQFLATVLSSVTKRYAAMFSSVSCLRLIQSIAFVYYFRSWLTVCVALG